MTVLDDCEDEGNESDKDDEDNADSAGNVKALVTGGDQEGDNSELALKPSKPETISMFEEAGPKAAGSAVK
jgi:hypothetical protein